MREQSSASEPAVQLAATSSQQASAPAVNSQWSARRIGLYLRHHPHLTDTTIAQLQAQRGNSFVQEVLRAKATANVVDDEEVMDVVETFEPQIAAAAAEFGFATAQLKAIVAQESRGKPRAAAGGSTSASGLMQVTAESWNHIKRVYPQLATFDFASHRFDPATNLRFGAAILRNKMDALAPHGVSPLTPGYAEVAVAAYNGGEGVIIAALQSARRAGAEHPQLAAMDADHLQPAIGKFPSVYQYYLTGGGKRANPQRSIDRAIELKYLEMSKYPDGVRRFLRVANAEAAGVRPESFAAHKPADAESANARLAEV